MDYGRYGRIRHICLSIISSIRLHIISLHLFSFSSLCLFCFLSFLSFLFVFLFPLCLFEFLTVTLAVSSLFRQKGKQTTTNGIPTGGGGSKFAFCFVGDFLPQHICSDFGFPPTARCVSDNFDHKDRALLKNETFWNIRTIISRHRRQIGKSKFFAFGDLEQKNRKGGANLPSMPRSGYKFAHLWAL